MVTVETGSEYTTPNNLKDYHFIQAFLFYWEKIWNNIKILLLNIGAYDFIDKILLLSIKHPYIAISAGICIIAFLLPFLIVLVFIVSSIIMAFTGFVLIEGTLITIASVILFGCLGAILIVLLFFGVITINKNNEGDENSSNIPDPDDQQIIQKMIMVMERLWKNLKLTVVEILKRIGAYDLYNRIIDLSSEHPYLTVTAAITLVTFMLPFIIIIMFAISTVVLTFSGFAIIEGTLIAFISMILFGCLGAIVLASLFFGAISVGGYFGVLQITELYNRIINYSNKNLKSIRESEN